MAKRQPRFNYAHVETAMCLWEAFMDIEQTDHPMAQVFVNQREGLGAYELRRIMHELAKAAGKMWDKTLTDQERGDWTFDWEFCPMFLCHAVDWSDGTQWQNETPPVFKDGWTRMKAHDALNERFGRTSA